MLPSFSLSFSFLVTTSSGGFSFVEGGKSCPPLVKSWSGLLVSAITVHSSAR